MNGERILIINKTFLLINSKFIASKACCVKCKCMYSRIRAIFDVIIVIKT